MKNFLLTSVALIGAGTAASASSPMPFSWAGCYIGAHAGGGWAHKHASHVGILPGSVLETEAKLDGWLAGGQFGCDYQPASNFVVGWEGSAAWADIHGESDPYFSGKNIFHAKTHWIASATARVGVGTDRWLIFARGGGAWAGDKYRIVGEITGNPFRDTGRQTRSGWVLGGGIEWIFAPNWSVKLEYNHYDFGADTVFLADQIGVASLNTTIEQRVRTVIVGVNHRFATGTAGPFVPPR